MNPEQRLELASFWQGNLQWDVNMGKYSTLRAGGKAEVFIDVVTVAKLCRLLKWLDAHDINWRVIGGGSNILVSSEGFDGVIIRLLGEFQTVGWARERAQSTGSAAIVQAGGGCSLARLVSWCTEHELEGMECMAGIPGSVGGAVRMNAGAFGSTIGEYMESVQLVDYQGVIREVEVSAFELSYRHTALKDGNLDKMVITGTRLSLLHGNRSKIHERCRVNLTRRREKQPAGVASAGSFFKNPEGDFAGRLIEAAGLKGLRRGKAMVSDEHANFIVNTGGATAADITGLMREVQEKVYRDSGILLESEVYILWNFLNERSMLLT